jgi:hypothetical protein
MGILSSVFPLIPFCHFYEANGFFYNRMKVTAEKGIKEQDRNSAKLLQP